MFHFCTGISARAGGDQHRILRLSTNNLFFAAKQSEVKKNSRSSSDLGSHARTFLAGLLTCSYSIESVQLPSNELAVQVVPTHRVACSRPTHADLRRQEDQGLVIAHLYSRKMLIYFGR